MGTPDMERRLHMEDSCRFRIGGGGSGAGAPRGSGVERVG
jgi:hypothetical protein